MKSNSLIFKTRLIGALSALLLIAFAVFFTIFAIFFDKRTEIRNIVSVQKEIQSSQKAVHKILKNHHLQMIDMTSALKVKREGTHILNDPLIREVFALSNMSVYTYKGYYYYGLRDQDHAIWLKSEYHVRNYLPYIFTVSALVILLLLWLHLYIQSSLRPLKALHTQIIDYGKSKKLIPLSFKNSDEISTLADAFYDSVDRLHAMQQSRTTLINTFMHEIKSTLTKLILRTHLLNEDNTHKENLLEHMNKMQNQLSEIQEYNAVMMEMLEFDYQEYYLNSILDEVLYALKNEIDYDSTQNPILEVDKHLFATALKALLQNATDVKVDKQQLTITKALKKDKKIDLDLDIAQSILDKHEFTLEISKESNQQRFVIYF